MNDFYTASTLRAALYTLIFVDCFTSRRLAPLAMQVFNAFNMLAISVGVEGEGTTRARVIVFCLRTMITMIEAHGVDPVVLGVTSYTDLPASCVFTDPVAFNG